MSAGVRVIDALGTWCPVPIYLIDRAARGAPAGALIELLADDPLIEVDLPAWCHRSGNALLELRQEEGAYVGRVEVMPHEHGGGRGPPRDPSHARSASD